MRVTSERRFGINGAICAIAALALLAPASTAAAAREAFLSNMGANNVRVFDTGTNSVVGSAIGVGSVPLWVALAPDGRRAYVSNSDVPPFGAGGPGSSMSAIDTSSKSQVANFAVGTLPLGIAVSPTANRAYVGNRASNSVSVVDTAANSQLTAIPVGTNPIVPSVTPDGARVYVSNEADGTVSVIDTSTNTATTPISGLTKPTATAASPNGGRVYASEAGPDLDTAPDSYHVIDTATNTIIRSITVGNRPGVSAITPDGGRAYVVNEGLDGDASPDSVSVIDLATSAVVATIEVGLSPRGISMTPDGSRAYVVDLAGNNVRVIDTASNTVTTTVSAGTSPFFLGITPDQGPTASFTATAGTAATAAGADTAETTGATTTPAAAAGAAASSAAGVPTTFDASASSDPDGTVARYDWDFGDGTTLANGGATPSHTYANPRTYEVTLTVTDNEGCSDHIIHTGQTALCNGSAAARASHSVTVRDAAAPAVTIDGIRSKQRIKRRKLKKISGTASDVSGIRKVVYALALEVRTRATTAKKTTKRCRYLKKKSGKLTRKRISCEAPRYLRATGTTAWSAKLKRVLPKGSYTLRVRATDNAGNKSEPVEVAFRLV